MLKFLSKLIKNYRVKRILVAALVLALLFSLSGVQIQVASPEQSTPDTIRFDTQGIRTPPTVSIGQITFTVGTVQAAGTADYTCDGVADDVQFQAALNALPATGGKLFILAGTYNFSNAVSRAIDNVTIEGVGFATSITRDGVNPIFTTGVQSNWTFISLALDAGGVNDTGASEVTYENVDIGGTHWAYDTSHDIGGASWDIPTGRGVTFIVAASDAEPESIAQADYWCDGTADNVQIQAAVDAAVHSEMLPPLLAYAVDGAVFTDETVETVNNTANDMTLLPAIPAVNDAYYFISEVPFNTININIGTAGAGNWTITWEYYQQGSAWAALAGVVDGTNGFTTGGTQTVTFTLPTDWMRYLPTSATLPQRGFMVRARVSNYVAVVTQPLGTQATLTHPNIGGNIKLTEGTFVLSVAIDTSPAFTHLVGTDSTLLRVANNAQVNAIEASATFGLVIEKLQIDGNAGNNVHAVVDGIQSGIHFLEVYGSTIRDVESFNTWRYPIQAVFSGELTIDNVSVHDSRATSGLIFDDVTKSSITNSRAYHNYTHGFWIYNSAYNTLSNNQAFNNETAGASSAGIEIDSVSASYPSIENIITSNVLYDNYINIRLNGVGAVFAERNTVSNNQIMDSVLINVMVQANARRNTFVGNTILRGDNAGVGGFQVNEDSDYNFFASNHVYGAGYGVSVANANCDGNIIKNNDFVGSLTTGVNDVGTGTIVEYNEGYVTENSGTATLLNGNVSVVVAHGLATTPTVILITFAENPTNLIADWWIDTVGAVNFTFNGVDPGASNLDFYWEAKVR